MDKNSWATLLETWSAAALARVGEERRPGPFSGLGVSGATESTLASAEQRLGVRLPSSYRSFLECTNGLRQPKPFLAARGGDFWPVEELDWFRTRNQDWIDAYTTGGSFDIPDSLYFVYGAQQDCVHFRPEYLRDCLEISHDGDSAIYLLNPRIVTADGEWEAWFFANWNPGADRYPSFADLMQAHYQSFLTDDVDGF
jgi:hypothetical protein